MASKLANVCPRRLRIFISVSGGPALPVYPSVICMGACLKLNSPLMTVPVTHPILTLVVDTVVYG